MRKMLKVIGTCAVVLASKYIVKRLAFSALPTVNAGDQLMATDHNNVISLVNTHDTTISSHTSTLSTHTSQISTANSNITTAQNTANSANSSASSAQSTANSANSAASNAQNSANNAQSTANNANGGNIPGVYSPNGNIQFYINAGYVGQFLSNGFYVGGGCQIGGTLSKGGGSFKIDHPLDPENKYLSHSFVESPDMKNIYDGIVTCDEEGTATIKFPEWFDILNEHFRYQVTPLGEYAPVYIAQEIETRSFVIKGGTPNMRVSWQVTGTRKDAFAQAHPIIVEEEKVPYEQGFYLHPELYGAPQEKSIFRIIPPGSE